MEQIYVVLEAESFDDLCALIYLKKGYTPYGGVGVRGTTFSQVLLRSDAQKTQEILFAELLGLGRSCPKNEKWALMAAAAKAAADKEKADRAAGMALGLTIGAGLDLAF